MGNAIRFASRLPQDLQEVGICCAGIFWQSNFEFWAHQGYAVKAGVPKEAVEAMRAEYGVLGEN